MGLVCRGILCDLIGRMNDGVGENNGFNLDLFFGGLFLSILSELSCLECKNGKGRDDGWDIWEGKLTVSNINLLILDSFQYEINRFIMSYFLPVY